MRRAAGSALHRGASVGVLVVVALSVTAASARAGSFAVQLGTTPAGCVATGWFGTGMTGSTYCTNELSIFDNGGGWAIEPATQTVGAGNAGEWTITAPAGITIENVTLPTVQTGDLVSARAHGWQASDYWTGGSTVWSPSATSISEGENTPLDSSYYRFKLSCDSSSCNNQGFVDVPQIDLEVSETEGPALTAVGSDNLWYQGAHYVWNPVGDPWSIALSASDPSGVCSMWAFVSGVRIDGPTATPVDDSFQQCPSPASWGTGQGASIDTDQYVPAGTAGSLSLQLDATNAAGVTSSPSKTLRVDNIAPTVTLSTPDDPNPSVWVNHPVTVDATAHAGPSGIAGTRCSLDGASAQPYPAGGVSVNGNGVHTLTCTTANNAVDPQGQPNTGSSSVTIHIDEAPPSLSFAPLDPSDPDQVAVDTSDNESGVAGGQIEIAAAATSNWTVLPTSFDGRQLLARIDDAGLHGPYTVRATSCDKVGNCATSTETLTMPLRIDATSDVSLKPISSPARTVTARVLVGYHYKLERRHGKTHEVKVGGHQRKIRVVIAADRRCARTRVNTGRDRWRELTVCRRLELRIVRSETVAHGHAATVHGLLLSGQGAPLANARVAILTAPQNGLHHFTRVAITRTNHDGVWAARLPAGPSRIIHAVYPGSPTMLPATGTATIDVPAEIKLTATPHALPWSGVLTLRGHLAGGYVPPDGVALRLLVTYPGHQHPTPLLALRTTHTGRFTIHWTYGSGSGVETLPFSISTTAAESDYPFLASSSRAVRVTFGRS